MGTEANRSRTKVGNSPAKRRRSWAQRSGRTGSKKHKGEGIDQQLRESRAALEEAQNELESFCFSVSHDLRAPLRCIDGFGHALLTEFGQKLEPQARDYLQRIVDATKRMGRLMDELLAVSRIQRVELFCEKIDLAELAKVVAARLQQSHPERKVHLTIKPHLFVNADRRLMAVVLEKLFENAWKFTSTNPAPEIMIARQKNASEPVFVVRDNGVGFDMEHAGNLFKAFQRLHSQREFPGLGTGLAIARAIIRRHGGRIWADSAPGKGATFHFVVGKAKP